MKDDIKMNARIAAKNAKEALYSCKHEQNPTKKEDLIKLAKMWIELSAININLYKIH
jgi:hypothetical protein